MEYRIITSETASGLELLVSGYLTDGWQLQGAPSVYRTDNLQGLMFVQAITKVTQTPEV